MNNKFNNLYNKIIKEQFEYPDQKKARLKKEFIENIDDRTIYKVEYHIALGTIVAFEDHYIYTKAYTEEEAIEKVKNAQFGWLHEKMLANPNYAKVGPAYKTTINRLINNNTAEILTDSGQIV